MKTENKKGDQRKKKKQNGDENKSKQKEKKTEKNGKEKDNLFLKNLRQKRFQKQDK